MANKYLDTALVDKAIKFAVDAHANTERRGKGFPYVIHVLEAMEIVATISNDPELLAAAALHDTVEDTDVTVEQIRAEFGNRIADIVKTESDEIDPNLPESETWRARKQAAINRLKAASRDSKIVAMGDKLSNMRAIMRDYDKVGDKIWSIFHAPGGKADHEWHYRGLAASLSDLAGTHAYAEFNAAIEHVFGTPAPELVDMNDWEVSGDGFTAISYNHKDGKVMMKLYADFMPSTVPIEELRVAKAVRDMGIETPAVNRLVTDGTRIGVEFERVTGKRSFSRAISQEPENMDKYMREFARECRKLHATPCNTKEFNPVEDRFLRAVNGSKILDEEQKHKMAQFIATVPATRTCIHGDMHMGNLLMTGDRIFWIDLADFAYGNPLFDLGMLRFVALNEDEAMSDRIFHLSCAQMHQAWDIFVDEYFGHDADKDAINAQIDKIVCLYIVFFADRGPMFPWMMPHLHKYMFDC